MVMTHFYQRNVFESCLKIFARLRAKILQIRAKTGHFGVKMGITISSCGRLNIITKLARRRVDDDAAAPLINSIRKVPPQRAQ